MTITGFRHLALTVTDLHRSAAWYTQVLGFERLFEECGAGRSVAVLHVPDAGVVVGLVQFADGSGEWFSPKRTGLDHLCFEVASRQDLEAWVERLDADGVTHSGIAETPMGPLLNFKDPDGIALAFRPAPGEPANA